MISTGHVAGTGRAGEGCSDTANPVSLADSEATSVVGNTQYAMQWSDLMAYQPALGESAHEKLIKPGVLFVGTVRRDGSPRISGAEPRIMDGQLWLSMLQDSMKARDLARDPRVVHNSIVTGPEPAAEIKVRGTVRSESDHTVHQRYATAVATQLGWQPVVGRFALFVVRIDDVTYILATTPTPGANT
jgi:hypothetical protein